MLKSQTKSNNSSGADRLLIGSIQSCSYCSVFLSIIKDHSYPKRRDVAANSSVSVGNVTGRKKSSTKSAKTSVVRADHCSFGWCQTMRDLKTKMIQKEQVSFVPGVPTSFRQEFSKKSLNVTNSQKARESVFTL